jgi:membrane protein DedA with SNARE-associated domain
MFLDLSSLESLVLSYSYVAIFFLMMLESIVLPIPSEIVLPFAGFLVYEGAIRDPVLAFIVAVVGSLIGNLIGFWLGYVLGVDVVKKHTRLFRISAGDYEKAEKWIKKYGNFFAFVSKLLPAIRSVSGIICGAFEMDLKGFIAYTAGGVLIWSAALMYSGYLLAKNWDMIASLIYNSSFLVVVGALIVVLFILRKRISKYLSKLVG